LQRMPPVCLLRTGCAVSPHYQQAISRPEDLLANRCAGLEMNMRRLSPGWASRSSSWKQFIEGNRKVCPNCARQSTPAHDAESLRDFTVRISAYFHDLGFRTENPVLLARTHLSDQPMCGITEFQGNFR